MRGIGPQEEKKKRRGRGGGGGGRRENRWLFLFFVCLVFACLFVLFYNQRNTCNYKEQEKLLALNRNESKQHKFSKYNVKIKM